MSCLHTIVLLALKLQHVQCHAAAHALLWLAVVQLLFSCFESLMCPMCAYTAYAVANSGIERQSTGGDFARVVE